MYYHVLAILPGDRKKTIKNKSQEQIMLQCVLPFVSNHTINADWGTKTNSLQALELRVYKTDRAWDSKTDGTFEEYIQKKKCSNQYYLLKKKAEQILGSEQMKVFIIMPIQGEKYGTQNDQRIYKEFDERFKLIEKLLKQYNCITIRIDKEHPIKEMVHTIKEEIKKSNFIIADLTEERPSCYFEAGYAEALNKPIIFIASRNSIISTEKKTFIHFDVHMNVNLFSNHEEMIEKIKDSIEKNKAVLLPEKKEKLTTAST